MARGTDYKGARVLIKQADSDDIVVLDTIVVEHNIAKDWMWVALGSDYIEPNQKLDVLVIKSDSMDEIKCVSHRVDKAVPDRVLLTIYKHFDFDMRKDSRYRMNAQGTIIVLSGPEAIRERQHYMTVMDISTNGIGLLLDEYVRIPKKTTIDVYFKSNGWAMRARCEVASVFGPKLGCRLISAEKKQVREVDIINDRLKGLIDVAMGDVYASAHYIDLQTLTATELSCMRHIQYIIGYETDARKIAEIIVDKVVEDDYKKSVREFFDYDTINERLADKKSVHVDFCGFYLGWCRLRFIVVNRDRKGHVLGLLHVAQKLDPELIELLHENPAEKQGTSGYGGFQEPLNRQISPATGSSLEQPGKPSSARKALEVVYPDNLELVDEFGNPVELF